MTKLSTKIKQLRSNVRRCQSSILSAARELESSQALSDDAFDAVLSADLKVCEAIEQLDIAIDIIENP